MYTLFIRIYRLWDCNSLIKVCLFVFPPPAGVIVLAFVLCWLPFHVGRTIFSLSLGTGAEKQETSTDTNSHLDTDTLADVSTGSEDINMPGVSEPLSHSDSDAHFFEALPQTGMKTAHTLTETNKRFCDMCSESREKMNTHISNSHVITQTELQHVSIDTSTQNMYPRDETNTHMETHDDSAHFNTQHGRFSNINMIQKTQKHRSFTLNQEAKPNWNICWHQRFVTVDREDDCFLYFSFLWYKMMPRRINEVNHINR